MPALFLVLATTAVLGFFLLPEDLENLGQSIVATIAFSNNILIYLTSGYWAMEADFKPLVHTWSLGVEEQYYLVAPLIIAVAFRFGKKTLVAIFAAIFLTSLTYSHVTSLTAPEYAFLMIFTRAWQLAIGALVALA